MFRLSDFGEKYNKDSGIFLLMEDLDKALNQNPDLLMLGGGNPGFIPEMQEYFYKKFKEFLSNKEDFFQAIGIYDSPSGNILFRKELAEFFNQLYNWNINYENIALTHGSQNAFFILFNLFSGKTSHKLLKILFPILPEYIGYENVPLNTEAILSICGIKRQIDEYFFQYEIDKTNFQKSIEENNKEIGCIAISTPCNPTGKVFSIDELSFIKKYSEQYNIPVVIDCAYGNPFPGIVYKKQDFLFSENFIFTFSLSKTGLPGLRLGIVIAKPEIISLIGKIQAIQSLSPSRIAPYVFKNTFRTMEFYEQCKKHIKNFYLTKRNMIITQLKEQLTPDLIQIHQSEGAFFLWLIFPKLKISSFELYEKLKQRGLIVVPGNYYYPGYIIKNSSSYDGEKSIRISFSQPDEVLSKGIKILISTIKEYS
ncbi:MAG: valine--pyruvate transaminase [Leptospiraceae bacterium]|nr:MAG: valine--pyruvate transaminase [Leptospiraceae bacterium]